MSIALALAARVEAAIEDIAALKARTPDDIAAEERLAARLHRLVDPILADATLRPDPDHPATIALIARLDALGDELLEVLADEVGPEAAAAIEAVEAYVAAARKELPDQLRPYRMDRRLFATLSRLRDGMLDRFRSRTLDAMARAATLDLPAGEVRALLGDMLDAELDRLSRHAMGDARNDATEEAERSLGVTHHRWVTAGDDQVRPAHAYVDGEIAPVGEPFSNGWRRPGGIGCRCRLEPVLEPPTAA